MLAASLNAFFCASPIYGSAEDFTFLLDVTVSREVTPAAKQQIGETRKKCNSDDRRQWRKQGGAVGAAASRMRAAAKQTLGAATRAVAPQVTERASQSGRSHQHCDQQPLGQGDAVAAPEPPGEHPCPLRRSAPALPKGEPFRKQNSGGSLCLLRRTSYFTS